MSGSPTDRGRERRLRFAKLFTGLGDLVSGWEAVVFPTTEPPWLRWGRGDFGKTEDVGAAATTEPSLTFTFPTSASGDIPELPPVATDTRPSVGLSVPDCVLGRSERYSRRLEADLEVGSHDLGLSTREYLLVLLSGLVDSVWTGFTATVTPILASGDEESGFWASKSNFASSPGVESNEGTSKKDKPVSGLSEAGWIWRLARSGDE